MIPREMPNWIVALPLLTMCVLDLLWGLDLVVAEAAKEEGRWWTVFSRSGSFWLGVRFLIVSAALFGVLGVFLLMRPHETTPTWFGVAMVAAAIATVLAWWFLSLTEIEDEETSSDA